MISYHDAEVIGYVGNGEVLHVECLSKEVRDAARAEAIQVSGLPSSQRPPRYYWAALEEQEGLSRLSRYDVAEYESGKWGDIEYQLDDIAYPDDISSFDLDDDDYDYDEETVTINKVTYDVGAYVGLICDECGERIQ